MIDMGSISILLFPFFIFLSLVSHLDPGIIRLNYTKQQISDIWMNFLTFILKHNLVELN